MGTLHLGTSGWHYRHWRGPFYAPDTVAADWLGIYAETFNSVEVNGTFYRLPTAATVAAWHHRTPAGFVFALKASRYVTHMKKLRDPRAHLGDFFAAVAGLGAKAGPVLFQLPPRWHADADRLRAFLDALPPDRRYAFEFRDPTWFDDAVLDVLGSAGAASCVHDLAGETAPDAATADFDYIRLHGPKAAYRGRYGDKALGRWAAWVAARLAAGRDVYCYFDNDAAGNAPRDAQRLRARLGRG